MPQATTIPALPCASINDTLAFYVAMGFEITYQQTRPNTYGCVKYGDIELHFFSMKGVDPANSYSTCLVIIDDADAFYQTFAARLRQQYGKLPVAGIPRITKPSNKNAAGDYRFNVIDPGGNYIRFIQQAQPAAKMEPADKTNMPLTKLGRALKSADLIANARGDFAAAAQVLDTALAQPEPDATTSERVQAWVLRAEIAMNMGDQALAKKLIADVKQISLDADEREGLSEALEQAEALAALFA